MSARTLRVLRSPAAQALAYYPVLELFWPPLPGTSAARRAPSPSASASRWSWAI